MTGWTWTLLVGVALAAATLMAGQLGLLRGTPPSDLGERDGRLRAPSATPNSVSSQADRWPDHPQRAYAAIAPLAFTGDGAAALARLRELVAGMPGARVVMAAPGYLHVEFTTRWLKFTDDAEFLLDAGAGVIHVRSASRLGRRDFGVNRARVEAIRSRFTPAGGSGAGAAN